MIKHVVMWKLKEEAEGATKAENARKIKQMLEELPDKIPQLKSLEVGINILDSDAAYDAVLITKFDSVEDGRIYQNHPEHQKVSQFVSKVRLARTVVDYEC